MFIVLNGHLIKRQLNLLVLILLMTSLQLGTANAGGIFTGVEADQENSRFTFLGGQTGERWFAHFFAGQLKYDFFNDSQQTVESDTDMLTVGLGYRIGAQQNYSIALGATQNETTETINVVVSEPQIKPGAVMQVSAASYGDKFNSELLASYSYFYSTKDKEYFLWSRARIKFKLTSWFSTGVEAFWMGNNDADSYGTGILIDTNRKSINIGLKIGYKTATNEKESVYSGIEFYFPI